MYHSKSFGDRVFNIANIVFMIIIIVVTLYPFWYILVGAFSDGTAFLLRPAALWPTRFTLTNFRAVFRHRGLSMAFLVTIGRTVIGTFLHLLVTGLFSYAVSRKELMHRKFFITMGLITMFFNGGLIPYYLVVSSLGLLNSFWVYIFPGVFSFWNVLIFSAFFKELPDSLFDAARIDGSGEYRLFFRIVLPLSTPVFASLALFTAIVHWNAFFDAMLFTTNPNLRTAQLFLMQLIRNRDVASQMANALNQLQGEHARVTTLSVQLATMVVVTAPILVLYPFLQKYFAKGLMIGSVKG